MTRSGVGHSRLQVGVGHGDAVASASLGRRQFLGLVGGALALSACSTATRRRPVKGPPPELAGRIRIADARPGEDLFAYVRRLRGKHDHDLYKAVVGAANEYKEGDEALGIAAADDATRARARSLLASTTVGDIADHPMLEDGAYDLVLSAVDATALASVRPWKMGDLKTFLLTKTEPEIKAVMVGLPSDVIGMVVKLMSNDELVRVGQTVFNPLPGTNIGAKGYMGARLQPNSPTDNVDDILWQVLDGWSYGVGDVVLGNNPVSSEVSDILAVEQVLKGVIDAFGLAEVLPHCCLSHVDVQAAVEKQVPGSTALWFQSLGSTVAANATFDVTMEKLLSHAATRTGKYGFYFETGQGADATNGHGAGFDMVVHEARKYGIARALRAKVAEAQKAAGRAAEPWVQVNDVAGFIGPEVFRTKEQLVRCCLEDIVMGKLHGLPIGLDVCSTLHMDVGLDDLDWCLDRIMPANPAYLMSLPTKNDPMLSYLTTAFQDHVRIRSKHGYKVNDAMWAFFQRLGVVQADGSPGPHFGDPKWVYLQYLRKKGDPRTDAQILIEANRKLAEVRSRGVWIAEAHGPKPWDLDANLAKYIRNLVADGKKSIFAELPQAYVATVAGGVVVATRSRDRMDYILHPPSGEELLPASLPVLEKLRDAQSGRYDVQLMISDGLNAYAITDDGHVAPFLVEIRAKLSAAGYSVAPEHIVCNQGRVRAGYHAGEILFGKIADTRSRRALFHIIGERPGSEHHSFSVYMSAPAVALWAKVGGVDHNVTRVVANIADTALRPAQAAEDAVRILREMFPRG